MSYRDAKRGRFCQKNTHVFFKGVGFGPPTKDNPKGVRIEASGFVIVGGVLDKKKIPFSVIQGCKKVFMEQTGAVRFKGDRENVEYFPTVWIA